MSKKIIPFIFVGFFLFLFLVTPTQLSFGGYSTPFRCGERWVAGDPYPPCDPTCVSADSVYCMYDFAYVECPGDGYCYCTYSEIDWPEPSCGDFCWPPEDSYLHYRDYSQCTDSGWGCGANELIDNCDVPPDTADFCSDIYECRRYDYECRDGSCKGQDLNCDPFCSYVIDDTCDALCDGCGCSGGSCSGVCSPGQTRILSCGSGGCVGTKTQECRSDCTGWNDTSNCSTEGNWCGVQIEVCENPQSCDVDVYQAKCNSEGTCSGAYNRGFCNDCTACNDNWCGSEWEVCADSNTCNISTRQSKCGTGDGNCVGDYYKSAGCTDCTACNGDACGSWLDYCADASSCDTGQRKRYCQTGDQSCTGQWHGTTQDAGSGACDGGVCSTSDHCSGDTYYTRKNCSATEGSCSVSGGDIGCCEGSYCSAGQYCRQSDHQCVSVPECNVRNEGGFGYSPANEGGWCGLSWESCVDSNSCDVDVYQSKCSSGSCTGTSWKSDTCSTCTACNDSACGSWLDYCADASSCDTGQRKRYCETGESCTGQWHSTTQDAGSGACQDQDCGTCCICGSSEGIRTYDEIQDTDCLNTDTSCYCSGLDTCASCADCYDCSSYSCLSTDEADDGGCSEDCTSCVSGVCTDRLQCAADECFGQAMCGVAGGDCQDPDANATVCANCYGGGWDSIAYTCCGDDGAADDWCTTGGGSCISGSWNSAHCLDGIQNCDEVAIDWGGIDCDPSGFFPTVTTNGASSIGTNSATLDGSITDTGGASCDERGFDWGTTGSYGSSWTETGSYGVGTFSRNISSLTPGTIYHFMAKAYNPIGWGYGVDDTFLTKPGPPLSFTTIPENSQVRLSWSKGDGVHNTAIRRKEGGFPTDINDGFQTYLGPSTSYIDTGLNNGTAYYYRAWSSSTAEGLTQYSDNYAQALVTPEQAPACQPHKVLGWAWSENIGWINFSCKDCDVNDNGYIDAGACGGDDSTTDSINYGVDIINQGSIGVFSGYAWSSNVGWISFNETDLSSCPGGACQAWLDFGTNKISGWAKVLSDGSWISLRDQEDPPNEYGISWNQSSQEVEGWAWSDTAVGWISFNHLNCDSNDDGFSDGGGACPLAGTSISDYKVMIINNSPIAQTDCHPDGCLQPVGDCREYTQSLFCLTNDSSDPDGDPDIQNSEWAVYDRDTWTQVYATTSCIANPLCNWTLPGIGSFASGGNYRAFLKVIDNGGLTSIISKDFVILQDIIAQAECSLDSDAGWQNCSNLRVSEGEVIYFNDLSTPSDSGTVIVSWTWTFTDGDPVSSNLQNPSTSFTKVGSNSGKVTLFVQDDDGRTNSISYQLPLTYPLPQWREISPP